MSSARRKLIKLFAVCSVGTLLQAGLVTSNCTQFYGQALLRSFDPCTVFNCTGGTFFNLCEPVPLFYTCPNMASAAGP